MVKERSSLSVSVLVQRYVIRYPSIAESLRKGVINHSSLARLIKQEYPKAKMPAIIAAVRRLALRRKGQLGSDAELDRVFASSKLSAQGGIALILCKKVPDFQVIAQLKQQALEQEETFLFMEGVAHFTICCSQILLPVLKKNLSRSIQAVYQDLSLLTVHLPFRSVHTFGISARLTGLLAGAGIVIFQEMTSAGEYFIVIATDKLSAAISALENRRK